MEKEKNLLQVGDKIVVNSRYNGRSIIRVERVTKTRAIIGNVKLRREYSYGERIGVVGGYSGFGGPTYSLLKESDVKSIQEEIYMRKAHSKISNILRSWSSQNAKQIREMLEAYNSTNP